MRYLLLSVLVVCVIGVMIPNAFATTWTDPNNRFSIEYPTGWTVVEYPIPDIIIRVLDTPYNWNTYFNVEFFEGCVDVGTKIFISSLFLLSSALISL